MTDIIIDYVSGIIMAELERSKKILVDNVSLSIKEGESISIIGETGSGKTMIAQSIMGLLPKNVCQIDSNIMFCGKKVITNKKIHEMLGIDIVYIPQNGHEYLNPSKKIKYHLYDSIKKLKINKSERYKEALNILKLVGFSEPEEILEKYPFQLSGGMAQRVTIALAACSKAKLIIADEPTNGLDNVAKYFLIKKLNELFPKAAKLIITHDISVASFTDRILVLCGGKMIETGNAKEVLSKPHHPYTKAIIDSLVVNGMNETPILREDNAFCPFYKRCRVGTDICKKQMEHRIDGATEWWCSNV